MYGEGWAIDLTAVAANGNCSQLYPVWAGAETALASATTGDTIRTPRGGTCSGLQVKTDGVNAGTIEIWDYNGQEDGIDVSSAATITNAQIAAAVAAGKAKLAHVVNFIASPETPINVPPFHFLKGLVARFSNTGITGTCTLNLKVEGGYVKTTKI